jgi:malonate transporter and related proteins
MPVLNITVPFFALVLAGYLAARFNKLPPSAVPGLNAFILYFALPCMLLRFGANTPFNKLVQPGLVLFWAVCGITLVAIVASFSRLVGYGWRDTAFGSMVVGFSNTGYMGVPLIAALVGEAAAAPAIVTIVVDLFITSSLCIAMAELQPAANGTQDDEPHTWQTGILKGIKGAASNPLPWAIGAGCVLSAFSLKLPGPVDGTVALLANAASPCALFTIGASLYRPDVHTPVRTYAPLVAAKLLLHPFLVLWFAAMAALIGFPIERGTLAVLILVAALPCASNVFLFAQRYGADTSRIAQAILVSTACAFLTFSAIVWALGLAVRV